MEKTNLGKTFLAVATITLLTISVLTSLTSFTGYVTLEKTNMTANALSMTTFLIGLASAYVYIKKYKKA